MAKTTIKKQTRLKRRKEKLGIDWLTVSYLYDQSLFQRILNEADSVIWWGEQSQENFYTFRIEDESNEDIQMVNVVLRMERDGSDDRQLGTLTLHNTKKYKSRAFFSVENKALYTDLLAYLPYVEGVLNLTFNNITRIDIALTSTYNYIDAILKSVRNYDGLKMYYNGRNVVNPDETLRNFIEIYPESRRKKITPPTLVFGHKKKTGIQVRVYDKARELRENSPEKIEYLNEWLDFNYDKLYRIEITLTNVQVREVCSRTAELMAEWEHGENLSNLVQLPAFLEYVFCDSLNNVLRFKDGKQTIQVWDL